jgi:hypothetical protein
MKRLFIESTLFKKEFSENVSLEILRKLQMEILKKPEGGDPIPGTGGIRKMRLGAESKGKRGGWRVLYLDLPDRGVCHLLYAYTKSVSEDISFEQKKVLKELVERIKRSARR